MTRLAGASDPAAWAVAAKTWQGLGCPHRAGYAFWRQAEAQLDAGQPVTAAAAALRSAAAAADGHAPLSAQVRALAERARIPPQAPPAASGDAAPTPEAAAPYGLTGRELAVLRLLATGRTNAQIGAELYISPKTASVHVTSILRKLGVSNGCGPPPSPNAPACSTPARPKAGAAESKDPHARRRRDHPIPRRPARPHPRDKAQLCHRGDRHAPHHLLPASQRPPDRRPAPARRARAGGHGRRPRPLRASTAPGPCPVTPSPDSRARCSPWPASAAQRRHGDHPARPGAATGSRPGPRVRGGTAEWRGRPRHVPTSSAGLYPGGPGRAWPRRASVGESYDHYYGSGLYAARYPRPNPPTYRSALRLAAASARILDFGAGSGRYTLPLLHSTRAFICAYDISADARRALELQATAAGVSRQRLLVAADLDTVRAAGPYDLVISLFGVLSHIEGTEHRINTLRFIRSVLTRQGLLLLTVPNALRRFPLHASTEDHASDSKSAFPIRAAARRYFPSARPVTYHHQVEEEERPFPYYLFSRRELAAELSAAGFAVEVLESDSILPERRLVRSPTLAAVDDVLRRLLPAWAGYGLRATCRSGSQ